MKIHIRYGNNRLDIFDTDSFTKSEPFDGTSMLTNFEVRMDTLGNTGLWLMVHHYDASESYSKDVASTETPVARRKRGWRFLLAEASELEEIESVAIDGQPILMRIAGELVDMVRFEQMCSLWLSDSAQSCIAERALALYDRLCDAYRDLSADSKAISRMCGFSSEAIDELRDMVPEDDEENWMEEE